MFCVCPLSFIVAGILVYVYDGYTKDRAFKAAHKILKPLRGKDPYLDLRAAAFLTVGAMPEWLLTRMCSGDYRGWKWARPDDDTYVVERAGLDYLELMSEIDLQNKTPSTTFDGKPFPSADYRLPDPLKTVVGEIILLLSSLPDSGEEPGDDVVETIMETIGHLAIIDGKPFVEALHRHYVEESDKKKADYNGEVMRSLNAAKDALIVKEDERYKAVQRGMYRLSKINGESLRARESADAQRAVPDLSTR